ncbi:MAG TPA: MarR family transcriptional regulator [Microlunatus sp.]|nr:MarR family transcriptional regulator [Microlunatus sp.]
MAGVSVLAPAVDAYVLAALDREGLTGLRVSHGYLVQRLLRGPRSVGALAEDLGISQQAVSKSVAQLADGGYVVVFQDRIDGRRRLVELSERGHRAVARARAARAALTDRLVTRVGTEDLVTAGRVVAALGEELGLSTALAGRRVPPPVES